MLRPSNNPTLHDVFAETKSGLATHQISFDQKVGQAFTHGLESIDGGVSFDDATSPLQGSKLYEYLEVHAGGNADALNAGLEAAAAILSQGEKAVEYFNKYRNPTESGASSELTGFSFDDISISAGNEAFDTQNTEDMVVASAIVTARGAMPDSFGEAFFGTEILAAGKSGLNLEAKVPMVMARTLRGDDTSQYTLEKKSLTKALRDASILNIDSTKLLPLVKTKQASWLVADSKVATFKEKLDGREFDVRPILFDKTVDYISLGTPEGVAGGDETYTLDASVHVDKVWVEVSDGTNAAVAAIDVRRMPGVVYGRATEGSSNDLSVNANLTGISIQSAALSGVTGVGDSIIVAMRLHGEVNREKASGALFANGVAVTGVKSGGVVSNPSGLTITALGYTLDIRRSNTNMAKTGILIDPGSTRNARVPVAMRTPVSTRGPVNASGAAATMEALIAGHSAQQHGASVTALLENIEYLRAQYAADLPVGGTMSLGSLFVDPIFVEDTISLGNNVIANSSIDSLKALEDSIVAAVATMAQKVIRESGYCSSLRMLGQPENAFEVVLGTDRSIASAIMREGDKRTIGDNIKVRVVSSDDSRMEGKIIGQLRATGLPNTHPMQPGIHPMVPSLIYNADVSRDGQGTSKETMVQPREAWYSMAPVAFELTVNGMDEIFVSERPAIG